PRARAAVGAGGDRRRLRLRGRLLGGAGARAQGRVAAAAARGDIPPRAGRLRLAVLLALPVLDFGAISTRNQLARLESGEVSVDDFDYAALRSDFGEAGLRALRRMADGDNAEVAELAQAALAQTQRGYGFARP